MGNTRTANTTKTGMPKLATPNTVYPNTEYLLDATPLDEVASCERHILAMLAQWGAIVADN